MSENAKRNRAEHNKAEQGTTDPTRNRPSTLKLKRVVMVVRQAADADELVASINGLVPNESYAMTLHATLDGLTA